MKRKLLTMLLVALAVPLASLAKTYTHNSEIRTGKLSNGLTYYVVPNYHTSYYVQMYLCTNIGAAVEKPEEYGMAHFIEHCVFDGSKNFPDKSLIPTLEQTGIKYGRDLNAFTGNDFTTYYITGINGLSKQCIELAMTALHDMGNCADLTDEAIESERKIIMEEWRQGDGTRQRMAPQMMEHLYGPDTPYDHLPIGTDQTIANFTPEQLRDFYQKWYQPHHQAIIVVGYFEPGDIINSIKKVWKDVPAAKEPSVRHWAQIPDIDSLRTRVIVDPEISGCQMDVWFPAAPVPRDKRNTNEYFNDQYTANIASKIAQERLSEVTFSGDSPWSSAQADWDQYYIADARDAFHFAALYEPQNRTECILKMASTLKALGNSDVTQAELDRALESLRGYAKTVDRDYEEMTSLAVAKGLAREFNTCNPFLDGKTEKKLIENFCDSVSTKAVSQMLRRHLRLDNMAFSLSEKQEDASNAPEEGSLHAFVKFAWNMANGEAPEANANIDRPLIDHELKPGQIMGVSEDTEFKAKRYTLSNGANAVVAFRDNEKDQVTVRAVQRGGESVMLGESFVDGYYGPTLVNMCGMGEFSALDLKRKLAGTKIDIDVRHHPYSEIIEGECRVKELETLMQLMHLRLTSVREDSALIEKWKNGQLSRLQGLRNDPDKVFSDSLRMMLYGPDNIYMHTPKVADLDTLDWRRSLDMMRARFQNAANWDFIISGNVKYKDAEKLLAKYVATLPGDGYKDKPEHKVVPRLAREGSGILQFEQPMEKPFTRLYMVYEIHRPYELVDEMSLETLKELLQKIFNEIIREQAGATYTPQVGCAAGEVDNYLTLFVSIDTNAEMAAPIQQAVTKTLLDLSKYGVDEALFLQIKRNLNEEEGMARFYQSYPMSYYTHEKIYHDRHVAERAEAMTQVTTETVQQLAHDLLRAQARYTLIMNGVPVTADADASAEAPAEE